MRQPCLRERRMLIALVLSLMALPVGADVWYVNGAGNPGGTGTDWEHAFVTIQSAVNAAAAAGGGEVWVARGVYYEVALNGGVPLELREGVQVYGGFAGGETAREQRNDDPESNGAVIHGTRHTGEYTPVAAVVKGANDSILDGFTVTGGRSANGAGMLNDAASPRVENCLFEDNHALAVNNSEGVGGGMYNRNNSSPVVVNCVFRNNVADLSGGGIANREYSSGTFVNCFIEDNISNLGGGLYNHTSNPRFENCVVKKNMAVTRPVEGGDPLMGFGGGLYNIGRLQDQYPVELGTAPPADPVFYNCLFALNYTEGYGGAIFNSEGKGLFVFCTITLNAATQGGGIFNFDGAKPRLASSILYHDTAPEITDNTGFFFDLAKPVDNPSVAQSTVDYCDVQDKVWSGVGNISQPPLFRNPASANFHLSALSPCVDAGGGLAGLTVFTPPYYDFDGDARGFDGSAVPRGDGTDIDMGYDEFTGGEEEGEVDGQVEGMLEGGAEGEIEGGIEGEGETPPPNVIYVDKTNLSGMEDGRTWATAFRALQLGFDTADALGAPEVWVREGVYNEIRANSGYLLLRAGVSVYGGFAGTETAREQRDPAAHVTVIDGAYANNGTPAQSVVVGASDVVLDGFTIQGGRGVQGSGMANDGSFGAIANLTVSNCRFRDNSATGYGGAMYIGVDAAVTLIRCQFEGNSAVSGGGALLIQVSSPEFQDCTFLNNSAATGGAAFSLDGADPVFRQCLFQSNRVTQVGGALANLGANAVITGCTFEDNTSDSSGGAVFNYNASPRISGCKFYANQSSTAGGAIANFSETTAAEAQKAKPIVVNSVFTQNVAVDNGGAVANQGASPVYTNCTFYGNEANVGGAMGNMDSRVTITNCILWGNSGTPQLADANSLTVVNYSDVEEGAPGINISVNPRFVDAHMRDFHLRASSPCIDAGMNTAGAPLGGVTTDIEGDARGYDGSPDATRGDGSDYDIGADEFTGAPGEGEEEGDGVDEGELEGEGAAEGEGEGGGEGEGEGGLEGDVVYVDRNNASGMEDGLSWDTAYTTIQAGLNAALMRNIRQVWVAKGKYNELRDNTGALLLYENIELYGGFAGTETLLSERNWMVHATIIDGSQSNNGNPAQRVITAANNTRVDGFGIRGGRGSSGAGMLVFGVSVTLENCTFSDNRATDVGGALFVFENASLSVKNCVFYRNHADTSAGAVLVIRSTATFLNCSFASNTARDGAAFFAVTCAPELNYCSFLDNAATANGGAVTLLNADASVNTCNFSGNQSGEIGGALFVNQSSPRFESCRFSGNSSQTNGGAVAVFGPMDNPSGMEAAPLFVNCVFCDNSAAMSGGAVLMDDARPVITNCTLYGNEAVETGGGLFALNSRMNVNNCILWNNGSPQITTNTTDSIIRYCDVEELVEGTGNISENPRFVAPDAGDFHLRADSPCVNAGRNTSAVGFGSVTLDFDGDLRGARYDIGVDEVLGGDVEGEDEGQGEGEGEGQGGCGLASVAITWPSPNTIISIPSHSGTLSLVLMAATNCTEDTNYVEYSLDGVLAGRSYYPPYLVTVTGADLMTSGGHLLTAVAVSMGQGLDTVEAQSSFTLLGANAALDMDGNRIPDNPFAAITAERGVWMASGLDADTNLVYTRALVEWHASVLPEAPEVTLGVASPYNPNWRLVVSVPENILAPGESGLLMITTAPDRYTLLGMDEALKCGPPPSGTLVPRTQFAEISLLVSTDNGTTYQKMPADRLAQKPVHLLYDGANVSAGDVIRLLTHPTFVARNAASGLILQANGGAWTTGHSGALNLGAKRIEADLTGLSIVAPYTFTAETARLSVTPDTAPFGTVTVGSSATVTFTVSNTGTGILNGAAFTAPPFSIDAGGNYALAAGQSQQVVVRFTPTAAGNYTAYAGFSGGGGGNALITGTGAAQPEKVKNIWGCGPGSDTAGASALADLLTVFSVFAFLTGWRRRPRFRATSPK